MPGCWYDDSTQRAINLHKRLILFRGYAMIEGIILAAILGLMFGYMMR